MPISSDNPLSSFFFYRWCSWLCLNKLTASCMCCAASSPMTSTLWVGAIVIPSDMDLSDFMCNCFDIFFIELCSACRIFVRFLFQLGFMITSLSRCMWWWWLLRGGDGNSCVLSLCYFYIPCFRNGIIVCHVFDSGFDQFGAYCGFNSSNEHSKQSRILLFF